MLNTAKIQDIPPVRTPAGISPSHEGPRAAAARKAAAAKQADSGADAKHAGTPDEAAVPPPKPAPQQQQPDVAREVGLIDGSFRVYVDLVDPVQHRLIARVFGARQAPEAASRAYDATGRMSASGATHRDSV
jgi:plasmid stabilization system protein ParE